VTARVPTRLLPTGSWRQSALAAVLAAALAFTLAGCSPELAFPAIHDMPPPRADTPLSPDQVKQATDDLISERNHLSAGTEAAAKTDTKSATAPKVAVAAVAPAKKKKHSHAQGMTTGSVAPVTQAPTGGATQTAGADGKP
jgi:hypothetical protein